MSRLGYTNYPPTERRMETFKRLAAAMGLDADKHADRVWIIDWALGFADLNVPQKQSQEEETENSD